jgi:ESAT-6 family protein
MPDGGYKTSKEVMNGLVSNMMDTNEQLQDNGRKLAQAVDSVQGAWSGNAAMAFTNLMTQFGDDFSKMNQALVNIAEQVGASSDSYAAQEEEAASDISAIMSTLENG